MGGSYKCKSIDKELFFNVTPTFIGNTKKKPQADRWNFSINRFVWKEARNAQQKR